MIRLFVNQLKKEGERIGRSIKQFLEKAGIDNIDVVVGGDGTVLYYLSELKQPIFAVSLSQGRSGLCQADFTNWKDVLKEWMKKKEIEERTTLIAEVDGKRIMALNEIVIVRSVPNPISVKIEYKDWVDVWRGDGVLLSSATGSSAYAFSASGVMMEKKMDAALLVPINPVKRNAYPLVLSFDSPIQITIEHAKMEYDGKEFGSVKKVFIKRGGGLKFLRCGVF